MKTKLIQTFIKKEHQSIPIILAIFLALLITALMTYQPIVLQKIINAFANENTPFLDLTNIYLYLALVIGLFVINMVFTAYKTKITHDFKNKMRVFILKALQVKDDKFLKKYPTGQINNILSKDVDELVNFFFYTFIPLISDIVMLIIVFTTLLLLEYRVGAIFIGYFFISIVIIHRTQSKKSNIIEETRTKEIKNANEIEEVLHAKNEISLMKRKEGILLWLEEKYNSLWQYKKARQKFIYHSWITSLTLVAISSILALTVGGGLFFGGYVQLGFVFLVFDFSKRIQAPIETIQMHLASIRRVRVSVEQLGELAGENNEPNTPYKGRQEQGDLVLTHISYAYQDEKNAPNVLNDISVTFRRGQLTAVAGRTGSGKTTMLKLILNQLEDYSGEIAVDGILYTRLAGVFDINAKYLYFNGKNTLFKGTLKENITLDEQITDEAFFKEITPLLDKLSFRLKDFTKAQWTVESYENLNLSVEEIQVIIILRLFFVQKDVVILDEAISKVDKVNATNIIDYIKNDIAKRNRIGLIVTHITETLGGVDTAYTLNKGVLTKGLYDETND